MTTRIPLAIVTATLLFAATVRLAGDWPHWRGPSLDGVSTETNLPSVWTTTSGNIAWKLTLPAWSGATPIIWGEHIFLNVAEDADALALWAVDRANGKVRWKSPLGGGNVKLRKQNMSSPSPVTDGRSVWVMIGTGILKRFDFAGKELWARDVQKDYGRFGLNWGYASSPLLHDGSLFVQVLPMPVSDGRYLYVVNDRGIMFCLDAKTGSTVWGPERIAPGTYSASPVLADGKIYMINEDGLTSVVKAGPAFEKVAANALEDYTLSSPAISQGQIFIRTASALWAIGSRRK